MTGAEIEIFGIGGNAEWLFAQSKKIQKHGKSLTILRKSREHRAPEKVLDFFRRAKGRIQAVDNEANHDACQAGK